MRDVTDRRPSVRGRRGRPPRLGSFTYPVISPYPEPRPFAITALCALPPRATLRARTPFLCFEMPPQLRGTQVTSIIGRDLFTNPLSITRDYLF